MKSLKIIQTLHKIGEILGKIVFICCIIGAAGCLVGATALAIGEPAITLHGESVSKFLELEADVSMSTVWAAIFVGLIFCLGEIALAKIAALYFKHELQAGTPFTREGAKELLRLGICAIAIPLVSAILAEIACNIVEHIMGVTEGLSLDFDIGGLGLMFMGMSLLCRYGAEIRESKEN